MSRRLPHLQGRYTQPEDNNQQQQQTQQNAVQQQQQQQQQQNPIQQQQYPPYDQGYQQQQQQQQHYQNNTVNNQQQLSQQQQQQQYQQQQQQQRSLNTSTTSSNQSYPPSQDQSFTNGQKKKTNSKIDTDTIPRPLIERKESYQYQQFNTKSGYAFLPQSQNLFTTIDSGNTGPRYIRATVNTLPQEPSYLNQTQIPFGVTISPLAEVISTEQEVQVVDCRDKPIFRCIRCKAYVNPNFTFIEGGSFAICNMCKMKVPVPIEYQAPLDDYRNRIDKNERPELSKGIYDFWANQEYNPRPVKAISLMIALEMTPASLMSGVFQSAVQSLQTSLDSIPSPETTEMAIITYDKTLNFFRVPEDLDKDLQICVVSDLEDPYSPLPQNTLFMNVANDREKLLYIFEKLLKNADAQLQYFLQNNIKYLVAASLGAVVKACQTAMTEAIGRIVVFASQLPQVGFGKLKRREEAKPVNVNAEKTLYVPQSQVYTTLGQELLKNKIAVDLFLFNPDYTDLATISALTAITGGSLNHFPVFNPQTDGEKIHYTLFRIITRNTAYDCIMTMRTSQGIVLQEYYTGAGKMAVRDLELSALDSDTTLAVVFKQEEKITDNEAYLQYALLYTNIYGQRMVRVINLSLLLCANNMSMIFKSSDVDSVFNILIRRNIINLPTVAIKLIREQLIQQMVAILHSYRVHCAQSSSPGQLILPESLKILPLYLNSLMKKEILSVQNNTKSDDRIQEFIKFSVLNVNKLANWLYPKVYPVHNIYEVSEKDDLTPGGQNADGNTILPSTLASTLDKIDTNGVYIIDDNETLYFYIGVEVKPELLLHLFGVQDINQVLQMESIPEMDVDYNMRILAIIDQIRRNKQGVYQQVKICFSGDKNEGIIRRTLVEDCIKSEESYPDFLCTVHKLIQAKSN